MLNYASEYCEYCDACHSAVTVIMSSDMTVKSCIKRLTISYLIQTKEVASVKSIQKVTYCDGLLNNVLSNFKQII